MQKAKFTVTNMDCPSCAATIEKKLPGGGAILRANVNFASKSLIVEFDENKINRDKIIKKIKLLGFETEHEKPNKNEDTYYYLVFALLPILIIIDQAGAYCNTPLQYNMHAHAVSYFPLSVFAILFAWHTFKKAYYGLRTGNITAELYMSIGILASFFTKQFTASAVIVFYQNIGEYLDRRTSEEARRTIENLIKISPEKARLLKGNNETEISAEDVKIDDVILIRSGEKIPTDGVILEGNGSVNQSAITGESIPQEKFAGLEVFAGTILESGFLKVNATKTYHNTVFYKIITLIEEADKQKSNIQKIADKFAAWFLPALLLIAVAVYFVTKNLNTAISVIIISCPCAIAIATPLAIMASAGKLAKYGIIIKGGLSLEILSRVNTLVMDKTGTITLGEPEVTSVKSFGCHSDLEIMSCAASCEIFSEHHLAKAIIKKARELNIEIIHPDNFKVVPGKGVIAQLGPDEVLMSNKFLMEKIKIPKEALEYINKIESEGQTSILIAHNNEFCGIIGIEDKVRDEVAKAISSLKKSGIKDLIIVTGDNKQAAESIAKKINITRVYSEQLPEDKVNVVKALQKDGKIVAFVGDGINDAPALKTADLSIAMGAAGTQIAIETADIILMNDNLTLLPLAIKQGKRTAGTIKQNIFFGIVFNVVGVTLACTGMIPPVWAAMLHMVPDVFVFGNSAKLIK